MCASIWRSVGKSKMSVSGSSSCVAEPCRQPVAELDGAQRVEPRLHQRRVGRHTRQQLRRHLAHGLCHIDSAPQWLRRRCNSCASVQATKQLSEQCSVEAS